MKKLLIALFALGLSLTCASCGHNDGKTLIIDSVGDKVYIPEEINRVAITTEPAVDFMVAFGLADKIAGAYKSVFNNPWLKEFWPNCTKAEVINSYECETESLYASQIDLVFVPTKDRAEALRAKGLCAITLRMFSPKEVLSGVKILGDIFGDDVKRKAEDWTNDFQSSIAEISEKVKDIPTENRPSCYQLMGDKYKGLFRTNYGDTLDYFVYGGGRSALSVLDGKFTDAMPTEEAVLGTNPDVIFVNGKFASKLIVDLKNDNRWAAINAVKNNEIYRTPVGFCDWSNDGVELLLMNYWVFSKLYPERCDIDIKQKANHIYQKYFNKTFSSDELDKMFNILSPEGKELCD